MQFRGIFMVILIQNIRTLQQNNIMNHDLSSSISDCNEAINSIRALNSQRNTLELFQEYLEQTKVTYLDQHKIYAVVRVSYLEKLQSFHKNAETKLKQIQQKVSEQLQQRTMLAAALKIKSQRVAQLEYLLKSSQQSNKKLIDYLEDIKTKAQESRQSQYEVQVRSEILELQLKEAKQSYERSCNRSSTICGETQTEYIEGIMNKQVSIEENVVPLANQMRKQMRMKEHQIENISHCAAEGSDESEQEGEYARLKGNFERTLQNIVEQMDEKVKKLQDNVLQLTVWQEENSKIKEQNELLKTQLRQINEKEQKITIWKNMMNDFIQKVDGDVEGGDKTNQVAAPMQQQSVLPRQDQSNFSTYVYEERIRVLEQQILNYENQKVARQGRLRDMRQMLEANDAIPEENIINNLINLSARVKTCIQYLLEQSA